MDISCESTRRGMSSSGGEVVIEKIQMTCIHIEEIKPKDKFLPHKKGYVVTEA